MQQKYVAFRFFLSRKVTGNRTELLTVAIFFWIMADQTETVNTTDSVDVGVTKPAVDVANTSNIEGGVTKPSGEVIPALPMTRTNTEPENEVATDTTTKTSAKSGPSTLSLSPIRNVRLHMYDHCVFCTQVQMMLSFRNIPYERVVYGYGDVTGYVVCSQLTDAVVCCFPLSGFTVLTCFIFSDLLTFIWGD